MQVRRIDLEIASQIVHKDRPLAFGFYLTLKQMDLFQKFFYVHQTSIL